MRIAIDARELAGRPTGVGRYLGEILRAWSTMPDARAHEFVLCSPEPVPVEALGSLRVTARTAPGSGVLWEQLTLPGLVRAARADVLFAPAYGGPLHLAVPMVVAMHDVSFAAHPEWFGWREGARRRIIARLSARAARVVLTLSHAARRDIVALLEVDPAKVQVAAPGVTSLRVSEGSDVSARHTILYVGSILNRRHVPALIAGFARLARSHPDLRLEIVGDNRSVPRIDLENLANSSGCRDRIRIRAYVSDDELRSLYGSALVFAFLSEYEGFGLTPLEALMAGVPALLLDTPVAREVCGDAAAYVSRPDPVLIERALRQLVDDRRGREQLLAAADPVLARYSWPSCARHVLAALTSCAP